MDPMMRYEYERMFRDLPPYMIYEMANNGIWPWIDNNYIQFHGMSMYFDPHFNRPVTIRAAIQGRPEVPYQAAVKGHPGYPKGYVLKEAIPAIVGQAEVTYQPAIEAQPEVLATPEIKGATQEEVIAEINAIKSCTLPTPPPAEIPSPTAELSYVAGEGSAKIAKLTFTPDAADKEEYLVTVTQNGVNTGDGVSSVGNSEFSSAPLKPGCTDLGEFKVTRKSDDQVMTVINFNYPDQDFTKCEPEIVAPDPQATTDTPATTLAPVVDETAAAAVVSAAATEVQLPAADVNLEINLADVYTGFNIAASGVRSVEYQLSDGSWTAVKDGTSVKIPKTASKVSVRVTKTNGEEVISEKAIVRTEASTDTTMATTETTAPVATEEPASSDSSSSNNTLLYILGFVIVAGAAGFFIKKKSASTK
jgi:hypothetical protein